MGPQIQNVQQGGTSEIVGQAILSFAERLSSFVYSMCIQRCSEVVLCREVFHCTTATLNSERERHRTCV